MLPGRVALFPERIDHLPLDLVGKGTIFGAQVSGSAITEGILARGEPTDIFLSLDEVMGLRRTWRSDAALYTYSELPHRLADTKYAFGHTQNPAQLYKLRDVRDRFAERPFPITATCHTTSYYDMLVSLSWLWLAPTPYDGIACISRACRNAVEGMLRESARQLHPEWADGDLPVRLSVIHHGVDTERFRPRDSVEARELLGLPKDAWIALYAGRVSLADKMDLGPLLRAFRRVADGHPKALLVIAGEDTYGDTVPLMQGLAAEFGIAEKVLWWGKYARETAPLLYNAANVFVSPSDNLQETFGNTVLEAMASGTPVIAADWDGYRDIVVDGETGFLIPTYWTRCDEGISATSAFTNWKQDHLLLAQSVVLDVDRLAERMRWVMDHPAESMRLAENGRLRVLEQFAWPVIMSKYEAFWESLAGEAVESLATRRRQALTHAYYDTHRHYAAAELQHVLVRMRAMPVGDVERVVRFPELLTSAVDMAGVPELLQDLSRRGEFMPFQELVGFVQQRCRVSQQGATYLACALLKQGLFEIRVPP